MTEHEFRKAVKAQFPHVKVRIKTISFEGLGYGSRKCLTVTGDKQGEIVHINALAKEAGIVPDSSIRFLGG